MKIAKENRSVDLKALTRRRRVSFWGRKHQVTPRLVEQKFGDGLQAIWLQPLATRPNYYIVLIDSKWSTLNTDPNPLCDHLEGIYEAIESQFGADVETYEHENGRTY